MPFKAREMFAEAEKAAKQRLSEGSPLLLSPKSLVKDEEATVYIYDAIGGWFGIAAADFVQTLAGITARTIHLRINSPGGSVMDAEAIQTALQQHPARVVAHIDGMAASAATFVTLAADEVEISDGGLFMIHNAWADVRGNAKDMGDAKALLETLDTNISADYQRKTGVSAEQIAEWMAAETIFSAAEAFEHGFVDRIYKPTGDDPEDSPPEDSPPKDTKARAVDSRAARLRALKLLEIGL